MAAGTLRDRVTVRRVVAGVDAYGGASESWDDLGVFFANVRVIPGKERVAAGVVDAGALATVRLRDSSESRAITAADRMVFRGLTWAIRNDPAPADRGQGFIEFSVESVG